MADVRRLARLLEEHAEDLGAFLSSDPKGRMVPEFLSQMAEKLDAEQAAVLEEVSSLRRNVEHVKEIIAMQQSYARVAGVFETVDLADLLEDALRMNAGSLARHDVNVVRPPSAPTNTRFCRFSSMWCAMPNMRVMNRAGATSK